MRPVFEDDHHSHTYSLIKQEVQQLYFLYEVQMFPTTTVLPKSRNPVANLFNGHNGYVTKVFKFSQYL